MAYDINFQPGCENEDDCRFGFVCLRQQANDTYGKCRVSISGIYTELKACSHQAKAKAKVKVKIIFDLPWLFFGRFLLFFNFFTSLLLSFGVNRPLA